MFFARVSHLFDWHDLVVVELLHLLRQEDVEGVAPERQRDGKGDGHGEVVGVVPAVSHARNNLDKARWWWWGVFLPFFTLPVHPNPIVMMDVTFSRGSFMNWSCKTPRQALHGVEAMVGASSSRIRFVGGSSYM